MTYKEKVDVTSLVVEEGLIPESYIIKNMIMVLIDHIPVEELMVLFNVKKINPKDVNFKKYFTNGWYRKSIDELESKGSIRYEAQIEI